MKKLSNINESSPWIKPFDRAMAGTVRKEDGHKVHTCLGIDAIIETDCDYNSLIQELLNGHGDVLMKVDIDELRNYNRDEQANIRKGVDYTHIIYDGQYGTSLCASYPTYSDVCDFDLDTFSEDYTERDYIGICKCISEKLKDVGNRIEYIPRDCNNREYCGEYGLQLISETDMYNWLCDQEDDYEFYLDDFYKCILNDYRELSKSDFITWSYRHYGNYIAVPINYETLMRFKDWRDYTQKWFSTGVNESSPWIKPFDRAMAGTVRKEDKNNIDKIKPVDLGADIPVYIADIDYREGGEDHFTWDEAMEINEKIKDTGWRLPYGTQEICDIFFTNRNLPHELKDYLKNEKNFDELWVSFTSEKTGEKIMFEIESKNPRYPFSEYWCDWEKNPPKSVLDCNNAREFLIGKCGFDYGTLIGTNNGHKTEPNKIRLVKDK